MSEYTAHPTQPGNTHELTSPGTLNYDITRSGSTRRWGTEPQMKSSGNGSNNTEQRRNPKIPCPEISGLLSPSEWWQVCGGGGPGPSRDAPPGRRSAWADPTPEGTPRSTPPGPAARHRSSP